jgi:hypothetical protein
MQTTKSTDISSIRIRAYNFDTTKMYLSTDWNILVFIYSNLFSHWFFNLLLNKFVSDLEIDRKLITIVVVLAIVFTTNLIFSIRSILLYNFSIMGYLRSLFDHTLLIFQMNSRLIGTRFVKNLDYWHMKQPSFNFFFFFLISKIGAKYTCFIHIHKKYV